MDDDAFDSLSKVEEVEATIVKVEDEAMVL